MILSTTVLAFCLCGALFNCAFTKYETSGVAAWPLLANNGFGQYLQRLRMNGVQQ
jgi:hypothetical protein